MAEEIIPQNTNNSVSDGSPNPITDLYDTIHNDGSITLIQNRSSLRGKKNTCLGFQTGVGDFRWDAGAWNMEIRFTLNVQLVCCVT